MLVVFQLVGAGSDVRRALGDQVIPEVDPAIEALVEREDVYVLFEDPSGPRSQLIANVETSQGDPSVTQVLLNGDYIVSRHLTIPAGLTITQNTQVNGSLVHGGLNTIRIMQGTFVVADCIVEDDLILEVSGGEVLIEGCRFEGTLAISGDQPGSMVKITSSKFTNLVFQDFVGSTDCFDVQADSVTGNIEAASSVRLSYTITRSPASDLRLVGMEKVIIQQTVWAGTLRIQDCSTVSIRGETERDGAAVDTLIIEGSGIDFLDIVGLKADGSISLSQVGSLVMGETDFQGRMDIDSVETLLEISNSSINFASITTTGAEARIDRMSIGHGSLLVFDQLSSVQITNSTIKGSLRTSGGSSIKGRMVVAEEDFAHDSDADLDLANSRIVGDLRINCASGNIDLVDVECGRIVGWISGYSFPDFRFLRTMGYGSDLTIHDTPMFNFVNSRLRGTLEIHGRPKIFLGGTLQGSSATILTTNLDGNSKVELLNFYTIQSLASLLKGSNIQELIVETSLIDGYVELVTRDGSNSFLDSAIMGDVSISSRRGTTLFQGTSPYNCRIEGTVSYSGDNEISLLNTEIGELSVEDLKGSATMQACLVNMDATIVEKGADIVINEVTVLGEMHVISSPWTIGGTITITNVDAHIFDSDIRTKSKVEIKDLQVKEASLNPASFKDVTTLTITESMIPNEVLAEIKSGSCLVESSTLGATSLDYETSSVSVRSSTIEGDLKLDSRESSTELRDLVVEGEIVYRGGTQLVIVSCSADLLMINDLEGNLDVSGMVVEGDLQVESPLGDTVRLEKITVGGYLVLVARGGSIEVSNCQAHGLMVSSTDGSTIHMSSSNIIDLGTPTMIDLHSASMTLTGCSLMATPFVVQLKGLAVLTLDSTTILSRSYLVSEEDASRLVILRGSKIEKV